MIILVSLSKKLTVSKVKVTRVTHWKGQTHSQVWLQPPPPPLPWPVPDSRHAKTSEFQDHDPRAEVYA